jgi:putative transposase
MAGMPRRLRLQYPGAIYHLMARGNGRQVIVRDDVVRDRLQEHLGKAAIRCCWLARLRFRHHA